MTTALSRLLLALGLITAVIGAVLVAPVATSTPAAPAQAADTRYFDPGNIISDAVFFDGLAMDAGAIQDFLNQRGTGCTVGTDGSPCLKNYRMNTTDRAADSLCGGYRGAYNESAATVIARVAATCRVNPRVLLVLLQKEMGLVTATNPTAKKYERAAGYACPDTANGGCDPTYAGLQNQLYRSAWQYQRYAAVPGNYQYKAGRNNIIGWHPNGGCGNSTVYIANQATAGLYIYTPYRPNQRALDAGYGTGDGCSSYGNRNFWNYFTDWFGSTQSAGGAAIYAKYQELGGSSGQMGTPTSAFICGLAGGGCYQVFQGGHIYWSPATGAHTSWGVLFVKYQSVGAERGTLGFPVTDVICGLSGGGCGQVFERGTAYYSPTSGTQMVLGVMLEKWTGMGRETSTLGYPVADVACGLVNGGCYQLFQRGTIYYSAATGTRSISDPIRPTWWTTNSEWGQLGYPVTDTVCGLASGGCGQVFERGSIYSSPGSGTHTLVGLIRDKWQAVGWEVSPSLGYPTTDVACGLRKDGCYQQFERGAVYWTAAQGTRLLTGPIRDRWNSLGSENGVLGYALLDTMCGLIDGGCWQSFEDGSLYWTAGTGTHFVRDRIRTAWQSTGAEWGTLGYPVTDEICGLPRNGCGEHFQRGSVYFSPTTGAHPISGAILNAWAAQGWEVGAWGYPTGAPRDVPGGVQQRFEGGTAEFSSASGTVTFM